MTTKTILFVCAANICRSPMAAAIMRQRLAQRGLANRVVVRSAGVWAQSGYPASEGAIQVLGQQGMDLADHRSQPVTLALMQQADLILVMEEAHRRSLFYLAPEQLSKVFLLAEMAGEHNDVRDPYGGPLEGYEQTAKLLERLIERGMPQIMKKLGLNKEI